ncbi:MAG: reverse transcriptase domain-containing protein [Nanoarchaeota archaeon]|nr:reverse transcriptase domain-containing protein [Nanoarchaeota archaeon]
MKTYNKLYDKICLINNLANAWREARKGKTKKIYVIEFEQNTKENLLKLREELLNQTYKPQPLKTFTLRDPKTRRISKSAFIDRIVHHALVRVIEPIFDKTFIYDSCANRKGKGNLFALNRFDLFKRKVTNNLKSEAFCLKADIKHYFQEVSREVLLKVIKKKLSDERVLWLIEQIIKNYQSEKTDKGMPLGNLTSQFFANIYLNELDYFVKHKLRVKYYIRYVDDFVILHKSKEQLEEWKIKIDEFLKQELKLELHKEKSKIIPLSHGIDFVGFRNFYHFKLLRKRNIRKIFIKIEKYKREEISKEKMLECFHGWDAYAKWANSYNLRRKIVEKIDLINL